MLQVAPHVSRLPFLPMRVRGIFSYLLVMKWITSITMYHQLSNSGLRIGYDVLVPSPGVDRKAVERGSWELFSKDGFE